jgi:hypothetical protein
MALHRLPYPPYCPDIAPCDFWRSEYLKVKLEGMFLDAAVVLLAEVEVILGYISITQCVTVSDEWKDYFKRCINTESECLSND